MGSDISKMKYKTGSCRGSKSTNATSPSSSSRPSGSGGPVAPPVPEKDGITAGKVNKIQSVAKWKAHFQASKANNKLMVVYFTAVLCGPCRTIEPVISEFASLYQDVQFIKIDVDELLSVAAEYNVHLMPTFILFNRGETLNVIQGAKKEELKRKIELFRGHA